MSNKKVSELTAYTTPVSGDVLPINDNTPTTKKITVDNLFNILSSLFRIKDSSDTTKKVAFDVSGVTTGTTRTITIPNATTTMVGTDTTQTLTNKTLTSPVITSPALTVGSDATGDLYYRSAGGFTRIAIGTANYILRVVGGVPAWSAETTTADASTTGKGVVELATSAEVTAGTATGGTGAALVVTPDALAASTPVFNGSGLTGITTSFASTVQTVTGITTATNTDTTVTTGFTAKIIEIHFKMTGRNSAGTIMTTTGIAHYDGTTLKSVTYFQSNETTGTTYSFSINSTAPKAGDNDGSGNGIDITLSVNSVSSTQVVVRLVSTKTGSPTAATCTFSLRAWK